MTEKDKIYNEDCIFTMMRMEKNSIDMVLTSPPYDNLREYDGNYSFNFEGTAKELFRIIKEGGVVAWIVRDATINGSETGTSFKQALYFKEIGFKLYDTMIYKKTSLQYPTPGRYYDCFEYIFLLSKGKPKTINLIKDRKNIWASSFGRGTERKKNGEIKRRKHPKLIADYGVRTNIWEYNTGLYNSYNQKYVAAHPAVMPIKLAKDLIYSFSNEGDTIYDPFMGSGTTAEACIELKRHYIGSEINYDYCEIAERRIKEAKSQLKLL